MVEVKFKAGETVIKQGDPGEVLYVVDQGNLDCFKDQKLVHTLSHGEVFGELALLYSAPRSASIVANTDVTLWQLDRNTFNHVVKEASRKRHEHYQAFLDSVPVLSTLDHYEKTKLCDVIREQIFAPG